MKEFEKKHAAQMADNIEYLTHLKEKYEDIYLPLKRRVITKYFKKWFLWSTRYLFFSLAIIVSLLGALTFVQEYWFNIWEYFYEDQLITDYFEKVVYANEYVIAIGVLLFLIAYAFKKISIKNQQLDKFIDISENLIERLSTTINKETVRHSTYLENFGIAEEDEEIIIQEEEAKHIPDIEDGNLYTYPNFDMEKLTNFNNKVIKKFNYDITEPILIYIDDTLFGSGSDGAIISDINIIVTENDIGVFPLKDIKFTERKGNKITIHTVDSKKFKFSLTMNSEATMGFYKSLTKILRDKKIIV